MSSRWTSQDLADYQAKHRGLKIEILSVEPKASRQCLHCKCQFIPKKLGTRHKGKYCGCPFVSVPSAKRRFCSRQCADMGNTGNANPSWKGGVSFIRPPRTCEKCGKQFSGRTYGVGRFCSRACTIKGIAKAGKENPNWRGGDLVKCGFCGKEMWRQPALKGDVCYCSKDCFTKGEFSTRTAKRWQNKSKWGMSGTRSGKREDLGGQFFRSRWEANYARYLNFLREHGSILDWSYESETFEFHNIKKGTRFYTPDFTVITLAGTERHEVKGWRHPKGETALRRMAKYYPEVNIVLIDSRAYRAIEKEVSALVPNWEQAVAQTSPD